MPEEEAEAPTAHTAAEQADPAAEEMAARTIPVAPLGQTDWVAVGEAVAVSGVAAAITAAQEARA